MGSIPEIFNLPAEATVGTGDFIAIFDVSAGQIRKMTQANFTAGVGVTDHGALTGLTDVADHPGYVTLDGARPLTADWDAGSFEIRAQTFESDVSTGAAPFIIASTTVNTNLNADMVDGVHASSIYQVGGTDVALADGGTGASLADPGADRIMFWDESANAVTWLTAGTGLTITDTTLTASASLSPGQTVITDTATVTFADPGSQYTLFEIECWGGGGSGGKGAAAAAGGGGGGGGYERRTMRRADISFPVSIAIGAGGVAQTTAATNGNVGGTTNFGTYLYAYGGGGGRGDEGTGLNSGGSGGSNRRAGSTAASPSGFSPFGGSLAASLTPTSSGCGGGAANGVAGAGGPGDGCFGGGGGGASSTATSANGAGGDAAWGGAGGGAGAEDSSPGAGAGGTSLYGGGGGAGGFDANNATAGTQPGGGGGGSETGDSGKGGDGRIRITYW